MRRLFTILFIAILAVCSIKVHGQGGGYFYGDIYQAFNASKQSGKLLMVEFYNPSNYRSRWMNETILASAEVRAALSDDFILTQVDTQTRQGGRLAQTYALTNYPTIIVFSSNGNVVSRIETTMNQEDFIDKIETILYANDGSSLWEVYKIIELADTNPSNKVEINRQVTTFFSKRTPEQVASEAFWQLFSNSTVNYYQSAAYRYMLTNIETFRERYSPQRVDELLESINTKQLKQYSFGILPYDSVEVNRILAITPSPKFTLLATLAQSRHNENWRLYLQAIKELLTMSEPREELELLLSLECLSTRAGAKEREEVISIINKHFYSGWSDSQIRTIEILSQKFK